MNRQKKTTIKQKIIVILKISVIFYLPVLIYILFFFHRRYRYGAEGPFLQYVKFNANFVPFRTISGYVDALTREQMNFDIPVKNLLGNLLLFLPMGIYLPLFFQKLRRFRVYAPVMLLLLLAVELFQLITRTGSFDVDDIILNLLGAVIGFGLWKMFDKY